MTDARVYHPLSELASPGRLPIGDLLDDVLDHIWIAYPSYDATTNEGVIGLFINEEVAAPVPGISALTLAIGSVPGGVNFDIRARVQPVPFIGVTVPLTLRVDADILQPLKPGTNDPDLAKKSLDIALGSVDVGFDTEGNVTFDVPTGISVPRCMIGTSGVILQIGRLQWITPGTPAASRPPNTQANFTGVYFDDVIVELPGLSVPVGTFRMDDVFLGTGGFSGTITWSDPSLRWKGQSTGFTGVATIDIFGFEGALESVSVGFQQNALTACTIRGDVFVPYIDRVIGVALGFDGKGGLTAIAQVPTPALFASTEDAAAPGPAGFLITADTDAFTLDISRIEFHADGGAAASLSLSGQAKLKLDVFQLPAITFQGLRIDTNGNVAVDGGWLDVDTAKSSSLSGFPFQITKIGFGAEADGHSWVGLNGGIKLADGLPVGASVEGLRVRWKPGSAEGVTFSLDGIGLELSVPGTFSFAGKVAFFKTPDASGFRGTLKLSLDTLSLSVDAGFMIGQTTDGVTFFYFFLDLELPVGIPLFDTGAAIYGFAGLVATNLNPARADGEDWYWGYYRRPPIGVTDPSKWGIKRGGFAIGLGTTLGTMPDTGFSFSAKVLLILVLPGPQLLLQGKGKFVDKKPDQKDPSAEGTFEALLVLDFPAKLFQANVGVAFKISTLLEVAGGLDVAFTWSHTPPPDLWHIYLGEKTPTERRIHATLFKVLQGDNWLMINRPGAAAQLPDRKGDFELGGSIFVSFKYDFSIAKAWLDASMGGEAALNVNPQQFTASLEIKGSAGVSALGASVVATLDAVAAAKAPTPWFVSANIEVDLKVDLLIKKWEFHAALPFELGDQTQPLPDIVTGLAEISADHAKVDEAQALDQAFVPPDVRPVVVFARPVQDRARFGSPGKDDTTPDDLGLIQVSYQLRHVVLLATGSGVPRLVGAAGEASVSGNTATFSGLTGPNGLPDLTGATLSVFSPSQTPIGPLAVTGGSGNTASFRAACPPARTHIACRRRSRPRPCRSRRWATAHPAIWSSRSLKCSATRIGSAAASLRSGRSVGSCSTPTGSRFACASS